MQDESAWDQEEQFKEVREYEEEIAREMAQMFGEDWKDE